MAANRKTVEILPLGLYDTLGLSSHSSTSDIINSFVNKTKVWHENGLATSDEYYIMLHYAFCVLGDSKTREEYNMQLANWNTIVEKRHKCRLSNKNIQINVSKCVSINPQTRTTYEDVGVENIDK